MVLRAGLLCALMLSGSFVYAEPLRAPDLSRLPEIDDHPPPPPAPAIPADQDDPLLGPPATDPVAGRAYLGAPLAEPHVDFVPAGPSAVMNPRSLWDAMLQPQAPQPEAKALRLRYGAIALFSAGGVGLLTTLLTLGQSEPSPAIQGLGYTTLGLSVLSITAGGVLITLSNRRLRAARGVF